MLRQPKTVSKKEKYDYVEEVIKMLNMGDFANAVVGVPGEGLNVEQRKLLTIGVELAAKPKLLLFLDEPTSGLDSQVGNSESTHESTYADTLHRALGLLSPSSRDFPPPAKRFSAQSINPAPSSSRSSTACSSSPRVERQSTLERLAKTHRLSSITSRTRVRVSAAKRRILQNTCLRSSTLERMTKVARGTKSGTTVRMQRKYSARLMNCTSRRNTRN
jgi:hypothetical protein